VHLHPLNVSSTVARKSILHSKLSIQQSHNHIQLYHLRNLCSSFNFVSRFLSTVAIQGASFSRGPHLPFLDLRPPRCNLYWIKDQHGSASKRLTELARPYTYSAVFHFLAMSSCCRTCDHRNDAVNAFPSAPSQLDVCLITLNFMSPISPNTRGYIALNTALNNIIDNEETSSHPTTFTSWSPCLTDDKTAIIVSTARESCSGAASPVFDSLLQYLVKPPSVQHIYLDYSVLSLAASSSDQHVPVDITQLQATNPGIAAGIGKHFGWDPKRSSLSLQMSSCASAGFSRPGDLIKDFWAWVELPSGDPTSPSTNSSSFTSSHESLPRPLQLRSLNSDEKNMSLPFPSEDDIDEQQQQAQDDETLVMIFQWSSHTAADRFKHPLQPSYGQNGQKIRQDLWDTQVAHPVRQLQGLGVRVVTYKLELRAVEPRQAVAVERTTGKVRSGSKRLSLMASGLSEKVTGLWR
jgi:hypothetical protein